MKSKAKPAKGSARTKRFDVGGTVGALAGLGTLAYLMSRKKKGETESSDVAARRASGAYRGGAGTDTTTDTKTDTTTDTTTDNKSVVKPPPGVIFEEDRARDEARRRALDQSKDPRANYMPEGADRKVLYSDVNAKRTDIAPVVKKKKDGKKDDKKDDKKAGADDATAFKGLGMSGSDTGAPDKTLAGQGGYQPPTEQHAAEVNKIFKDVKDPNKGKYAGKGKRAVSKAGKLTPDAYKDTSGVLYDVEGNPVRQATRKGRDARPGKKAGGAVKKYASGGSVSSASKRADGIAQRGKTRGKIC